MEDGRRFPTAGGSAATLVAIGLCALGSGFAFLLQLRTWNEPGEPVGATACVVLYAGAAVFLGFRTTRQLALGALVAIAIASFCAIGLLFLLALGLSGYGGDAQPVAFAMGALHHPFYQTLAVLGFLQAVIARLGSFFIWRLPREERRWRALLLGAGLVAVFVVLVLLSASSCGRPSH